jgi:hypothetical protein
MGARVHMAECEWPVGRAVPPAGMPLPLISGRPLRPLLWPTKRGGWTPILAVATPQSFLARPVIRAAGKAALASAEGKPHRLEPAGDQGVVTT